MKDDSYYEGPFKSHPGLEAAEKQILEHGCPNCGEKNFGAGGIYGIALSIDFEKGTVFCQKCKPKEN